MVAWREVEDAQPDLAERVRQLFDAGRHKTIATLRADGSPRISGIECVLDHGELRFGSMTGARKLADLLRDPRFALHSPPFHPEPGREREWPGEAKIAGRALPAGPVPQGPDRAQPEGVMFVAEVDEVVLTRLDPEGTMLVVEWWTPEHGLRTTTRS